MGEPPTAGTVVLGAGRMPVRLQTLSFPVRDTPTSDRMSAANTLWQDGSPPANAVNSEQGLSDYWQGAYRMPA